MYLERYLLAPCLVLTLFSLAVAGQEDLQSEALSARDKRLFSLFSVVTFKNTGCTTTSSSRNGTCYTTTECADKGGQAMGNCAAGFGVCCLFAVSSTSSTINQNCTYIQNPSFPSVYSATTSLTYTVQKCSADVCALRLDFETFFIEGPSATTETTGGVCTDSFIVTGSFDATPVICGQNADDHIYVDIASGTTATATLAFTFATTSSTARTWEVKVTQIPCDSAVRPPSGCLQYHTTLTGRVRTFNYGNTATQQHLASQNYPVCIRQAKGYCCVQYTKCDSNGFSLNNNVAMAKLDNSCTSATGTTDYVGIDGFSSACTRSPGTPLHSKICGQYFNAQEDAALDQLSICDCTAPFAVQIYTDATADTISATAANAGVCLEYIQIPCANV